MDPLGRIVRELVRMTHEKHVRGALELAKLLRQDGMSKVQVEEMLHASGFEPEVVTDAMARFRERLERIERGEGK